MNIPYFESHETIFIDDSLESIDGVKDVSSIQMISMAFGKPLSLPRGIKFYTSS